MPLITVYFTIRMVYCFVFVAYLHSSYSHHTSATINCISTIYYILLRSDRQRTKYRLCYPYRYLRIPLHVVQQLLYRITISAQLNM